MKLYKLGILWGPDPPEHASASFTRDLEAEDVDAWVAPLDTPHRELLGDAVLPSVDRAVQTLVLADVELVCAAHDQCYNKVKASYATFPSARASQAIAKCRKQHGQVRKTEKGRSLKRWQREKWKDKITGKPCGHPGKNVEYCRPSKHVSSKTPKMYSGKKLASKIRKKQSGQRAT